MVALNRNTGTYDTALVLRDIDDGAETTTAAETGIAFPCRKLAAYKAVFNISAIDVADADETYQFDILVSDLVGGTYTSIALLVSAVVVANSTGRLELPLSGNLAEEIDDDSAFIQVKCTIGGTTPSITYGCHLETTL